MRRACLLLLVLAAVLAACAGDGVTGDGATAAADAGAGPAAGGAAGDEVTIFAAASLTDAFERLGRDFEADHPGTTVAFNFAGSQQLATQITQGAPADVFASADTTQVDVVRDAGAVAGEAVPFAGNRLEIAVEPGNPRDVSGLADLADDDLAVVLADEAVPAGRYAGAALSAAGVAVTPASLETDVRAVLTKVSLGEADAGIVYASDVVAAGDAVTGVEIPDAANVVAAYPVAALRDAPNPDGARAFVDLLTSDAGLRTLTDFGFSAP